MKRLMLLAGIIFGVLASAFAFEVDIPKGGALWKLDNLSAEVMGGALRLREIGPKTYGTAKIRIPVSGARYLQIVAGQSEEPQHYISISNVSTQAGPRGCLFQGCNTFPLPKDNFTLALTLRGPRGEKAGGWYDIRSVRTVDVPSGGLAISADKPVVKVGDTFRVDYHGIQGGMAPSELPLQVFLGSSMAPVTFGEQVILRDNGKDGDLHAGDGIYSAVVKVTENATCLQNEQGQPLPGSTLCFAVGLPAGARSYGVADFSLDIATKNKMLNNTRLRLTPTAAEYRQKWENAVAGKVNLALGKPVDFSYPPNFHLTIGKNNTDRLDLTDGKLSSRGDDVLRFDSGAVGWRSGDDLSNGIDFVIDLGKVEPVAKAVIRINCGDKLKQVQRSPSRFAVLVSKDGKMYYPAAPPMLKLQPGEKDQSDFKGQFYLEENDDNIFCYPFELAINANARYVMVRVVPDGGNLYCDELAILKADEPVSDAAYKGTPEERLMDGCVLAPSFNGGFYIADNIPAPNYFKLRDLRTNQPKEDMKMVIELPAGIVCRNEDVASESIEKQGKPYTRFMFTINKDPKKRARQLEHEGVFFQAPKNTGKPGKAYFYVTIKGKPSHVMEREITVIHIPESNQMFRGLTVLSRMNIGDKAWPGYMDNLRKLGFSCAQIYPYYFMRSGEPKFSKEYIDAIQAAHKAGYKIVIGFNGLLGMYHNENHPSEDVWCLTDNPRHNPCPSFRGKEYQAELAKITRAVEMFKPAYMQWDIEHWYKALGGMRNCTRCQDGWKKSGKTWEAYLDDLSVELNRDLTEAVAKGARNASIPTPGIYNYNRQALSKIYHSFEKWELNKQFVTGSQPSLYVAGNEYKVHNSIKGNYNLQDDKGQRNIAPVLTPGTYGAYEPYHLEQMIYETMLNGAVGFFYYPWRGFVSPIYFYYHAKAMQNVIRHQELIFTGEIFTPKCDQANMTLSGIKTNNEALLLVGNYLGIKGNCCITPPFDATSVTDVLTGETIPPTELQKLNVPIHHVRLLHLTR